MSILIRPLGALLNRGRALGCAGAWVLTNRTNPPAMRVYAEQGGIEAPQDQVMYTFHLEEGEEP